MAVCEPLPAGLRFCRRGIEGNPKERSHQLAALLPNLRDKGLQERLFASLVPRCLTRFPHTASGNEPTWSDSPREVGYFLESSR